MTAAPAPAQRQALETILQDDAQLLHGDEEQVRAALAQIKEFGVDRLRLTAGWSVLTRNADGKERPLDFDATDPAAYEQMRWAGLDRAVRLAAEQGFAVMVDVGFWAPLWAMVRTALGDIWAWAASPRAQRIDKPRGRRPNRRPLALSVSGGVARRMAAGRGLTGKGRARSAPAGRSGGRRLR